MNRLDRLTAMLTQLQSKRLIRASEIAERFDISLRTVYRDIRALGEAGIPIIGEAGLGYSLVEGYRLPPVMFTREEAMAFLMAEKLVAKVTDKHNSQQFQSAMYKIKSVLKTSEKEVLEDIEGSIEVLNNFNTLEEKPHSNLLQPILSSIAEKKVVQIQYTTFVEQETTLRNIEPVGIYLSFNQWYLIAYCRLRAAYRTFRLDRLSYLRPTNDRFGQAHPSLKEYLRQIEEQENLIRVVVHVDQEKAKYLQVQKYRQGFVVETQLGDVVEMVFMATHLEGFVRWLVMMADHAVVIQPQALQDRLEELLCQMLERTKKHQHC